MDGKLAQIKMALTDAEDHPADVDEARRLADEFVAENPGYYSDYAGKSVHELVEAVDLLRSAGMEEEHWRVEAWLLHRFEPQNIGGPVEAIVRVPTTTGEGSA